ncbi:MAG: hypothetical protein KVP17_004999 [Porospora cf. gigantea B]|uniref:uncharacterized protein n=1 Tax=Porospora cf. gigantea B TaxID=2853592 RepID=UPI003571AA02|nr:MAG: hypothetical protein KVP17_004999 [Porospora cf. gigantea B]
MQLKRRTAPAERPSKHPKVLVEPISGLEYFKIPQFAASGSRDVMQRIVAGDAVDERGVVLMEGDCLSVFDGHVVQGHLLLVMSRFGDDAPNKESLRILNRYVGFVTTSFASYYVRAILAAQAQHAPGCYARSNQRVTSPTFRSRLQGIIGWFQTCGSSEFDGWKETDLCCRPRRTDLPWYKKCFKEKILAVLWPLLEDTSNLQPLVDLCNNQEVLKGLRLPPPPITTKSLFRVTPSASPDFPLGAWAQKSQLVAKSFVGSVFSMLYRDVPHLQSAIAAEILRFSLLMVDEVAALAQRMQKASSAADGLLWPSLYINAIAEHTIQKLGPMLALDFVPSEFSPGARWCFDGDALRRVEVSGPLATAAVGYETVESPSAREPAPQEPYNLPIVELLELSDDTMTSEAGCQAVFKAFQDKLDELHPLESQPISDSALFVHFKLKDALWDATRLTCTSKSRTSLYELLQDLREHYDRLPADSEELAAHKGRVEQFRSLQQAVSRVGRIQMMLAELE